MTPPASMTRPSSIWVTVTAGGVRSVMSRAAHLDVPVQVVEQLVDLPPVPAGPQISSGAFWPTIHRVISRCPRSITWSEW